MNGPVGRVSGLRQIRMVLLALCVGVVVNSTALAAGFLRMVSESNAREHQTCMLFEREHLLNVQRLSNTYAYLSLLPESEYGTSLTRALVRQLPDLERGARADSAPEFCDQPGVGLREPDPPVPARRDFSHLLRKP